MIVQAVRVATIRDGMEIEVEGVGLRKQQRGQLADPAAQQLLLVNVLAAIGVIGGKTFLG